MATATMAMLEGEKLIGLPKAASRFPSHRGGDHMHHSTIFRWVVTGAEGMNGEVVKLEAVRLGRRWVTSIEAIGRFCDRLAGNGLVAEPISSNAPAVGAKSYDEAVDRLKAIGA